LPTGHSEHSAGRGYGGSSSFTAEDMSVEVVATPVVVNDISLVVLDLVVTEGMGVDVVATPVVVDGGSSSFTVFSTTKLVS